MDHVFTGWRLQGRRGANPQGTTCAFLFIHRGRLGEQECVKRDGHSDRGSRHRPSEKPGAICTILTTLSQRGARYGLRGVRVGEAAHPGPPRRLRVRIRVLSIPSSSDGAPLVQGRSLRIVEQSSPTIHSPVRNRFAELADECDQIPATTLPASAHDLRAAGMRDDHHEETPPRAATSDSVQFDMTQIGQIRCQTRKVAPSWSADRGCVCCGTQASQSKKPMVLTATIRGS